MKTRILAFIADTAALAARTAFLLGEILDDLADRANHAAIEETHG